MDAEAPVASTTCSSAVLTLFFDKAAQRPQKLGLMNIYGLSFAWRYGKMGERKSYLPDSFFLESYRSNSECARIVPHVNFFSRCLRDVFIDEGVLSLHVCRMQAVQKGFAFAASRDDMPHSTNRMPAQFSDVLTQTHSKKLSLSAFFHVTGCCAD